MCIQNNGNFILKFIFNLIFKNFILYNFILTFVVLVETLLMCSNAVEIAFKFASLPEK